MKATSQLLLFLLVLSACQKEIPNRIKINIPTVEAETDYVWRTIQDTKFFQENNYQVSLPKGELIDSLKVKALASQLSDEDYEELKVFIHDEVYQAEAYQKGYEKIEEQVGLINQMLQTLSEENYEWGFDLREQYQINLTLYGPGGSYDPEAASILIFTTPEGKFKSYDNPANTIIHEMVHIGIEQSIINQYQVPHTLKERIVDTFVSLHFSELLPNYRIQNMGESRTDELLTTKVDLLQLDQIVEKVLNKSVEF